MGDFELMAFEAHGRTSEKMRASECLTNSLRQAWDIRPLSSPQDHKCGNFGECFTNDLRSFSRWLTGEPLTSPEVHTCGNKLNGTELKTYYPHIYCNHQRQPWTIFGERSGWLCDTYGPHVEVEFSARAKDLGFAAASDNVVWTDIFYFLHLDLASGSDVSPARSASSRRCSRRTRILAT